MAPPRTKLLSRRNFLKAAGASTLAGGAAYAYGSTVEVHRLVVEHVTITIPGLAAHRHNCRIVQLSDLHIGRTSHAFIEKTLRLTVALNPDFLLLTGDIVDSAKTDLAQLTKTLAPFTSQIPTLACTGNHDFAHSNTNSAFATSVCDALASAGVRTLRNQIHLPPFRPTDTTPSPTPTLPGDLCFVGLEDLWFGYPKADTLDLVPPNTSVVVLCHNPDFYEFIAAKRWHLMLSGHTHGGQVCVPFYGPLIYNIEHRERYAGLFQLDLALPHRALYVNRGIGHLIAVRFWCPPEITCLTLQAPDKVPIA